MASQKTAYLTSKTTRSISPFLTRFIAIGPPILPKPMNPTLPEADRIDEKQRNIILKMIIIIQYILVNLREQRTEIEQQKVEEWANNVYTSAMQILHIQINGSEVRLRNYENRELFSFSSTHIYWGIPWMELIKECIRPIKCTVRYICICYTNRYYT